MFDDIGGNIKVLAKIQFCIGVVLFCIAGISTIYIGNTIAGVLMIVLGILGSWITTFFIYGFGELIESTVSLNRNVERLHNDNMNMQQLLDQLNKKTSVQASAQKEMPAPQKPSPVEVKTENPSDKKTDIQTKVDDVQTSVQEEAAAPQSALPVEAKETKPTKPVAHKTDKDKLPPDSMVCPVCGKIQDIHNDTCESCGAKFTKWSKNHRGS